MESKILTPGSKLSLDYTLSTEEEVLDSTEGVGPLELTLGSGQLHPGIEKSLLGHREGESFQVVLDPSFAFGERDPALQMTLSRKKLPPQFHQLNVGDSFEAPDPKGKKRLFRLCSKIGEKWTLDGNHPLAGKILYLDAKINKIL